MTTKLVAFWTAPDDVDGFGADYLSTLVTLAALVPGLTGAVAAATAARCKLTLT